MKIIFYLILLLSASRVLSKDLPIKELKLECNSELRVVMNHELYKRESGIEYVTIQEIENLTEILLMGLETGGVRNFENEFSYDIYDARNQNKWELHNKLKKFSGNDLKEANVTVVIDRNSGLLDYNMYALTSQNIKIWTRIKGSCIRVDTSKKIF